MARSLLDLVSGIRRKPAPSVTVGVPGTAVYGGYVQTDELNANLSSREARYKAYSEILANTSIVAAGTRYFLNLTAKAKWTFNPSKADKSGEFAERAEQILLHDPATPWHRIIRRASMYRFYGFSIQEWTAKRHENGHFTLADVAPRPQLTIGRWDTTEIGEVLGVFQLSPQTSEEIYIPRSKTMYLVDDTLSDSPEGLGLFRHLIAPSQRLSRYEQLEGYGFETDLRGIPIGRGPFTELAKMVESGELTQAQRITIEAPLRDFIENHIKTAKLGMLLDSISYESKDEAGKASNVRQWDVELLKGSATSFKENAQAIIRVNKEMARILGVEQLMLGSDGIGSLALSKDKTSSFFLLVDSALTESKESVRQDLLVPIWQLNGWDLKTIPNIKTEAIRFNDIPEVSATLKDLGSAGATLDPRDPAINEIRQMLGLSDTDSELQLEIATSKIKESVVPNSDLGSNPNSNLS